MHKLYCQYLGGVGTGDVLHTTTLTNLKSSSKDSGTMTQANQGYVALMWNIISELDSL